MTNHLTVAPVSPGLVHQGTNVIVSWPQTTTTYVLEQTDGLSPANWLPAGEPVQSAGDRYAVTIPISGASQFFRLRKQ